MRKEKLVTRSYYDNNAKKWVGERSNLNYCLKQFKQFQGLVPAGKILDIGCGAGRDASLFSKHGYDYLGIDLSEGMLAEAKRLFPESKFTKMDLCQLKFPDETFDGVWSFAAYLHIPKDEINGAIKEMVRVLKRGGYAYVSIKKGSFESYLTDEGGSRYWSFYGKNQFAKILENNGLKLVDFSEDKSRHNPPKDVTVFYSYFLKKI